MRDVLVPLDLDPALPPHGSGVHALGGATMGTTWSAKIAAPGASDTLAYRLQQELDAIVAEMSHWDTASLLSRFNRAAPGTWHELPARFFEVVDFAMAVAADCGGAYDPFAGALVDLWGFGPSGRYHQAGFAAPRPEQVMLVLARRAAQSVRLDREARCLLQPGGAQLDLSSVAKGYAVDRLAQVLAEAGIAHYLVEVGGELRGAGTRPDGQPWWVEIEGVPDAGTHVPALAALHGLAIATSGDYRQFFEHGGERASHTLDPRTGYPVAKGVASVTVLAASCMAADALSTALTVMGPDEGLAFAERRRIAARFLLRAPGGLREHASSAWRAMLQ